MFTKANWINTGEAKKDFVPTYRKEWKLNSTGSVDRALLKITSRGVYEAELNGKRVGKFVLAPGWTAYDKRLQVQEYDVTEMLQCENALCVKVAKGWFNSPMPGWMDTPDKLKRMAREMALIAEVHIFYRDRTEQVIATDASWTWTESAVRFSEIYDGETYDATFADETPKPCKEIDCDKTCLIAQEGEEVREMERVAAKSIFRTPAGETVVDFGQEITGYVEFTVNAKAGDKIRILHGEVLDQAGNFYNANYRSAKAEINYTCRDGEQTWHPQLTFFGFRYLKLDAWPGTAKPEQFTGIVLYSNMRQTGYVTTGLESVNQMISNIFWGQKGNFVDVPTDCPQRDERLGWTGDAEVFCKAASLNFDAERFFVKWLKDLSADQYENGAVPHVIPDYLPEDLPSAAWADAATVVPWTIYQTYGSKEVLLNQFESMKKWVDYITSATTTPNLWTGGRHFADWLGLDAPSGSYKGSTNEELIASAFYAYSAELLVKAGQVLGKDVSAYIQLRENIVAAFRKAYPEYKTQTEHILAVQFGLAENPQATADALAEMIVRDGTRMMTGFVGTPFILHVLSDYGHADLAWSLLLREQYPSWLYPITKGATTIWEHWDGIMENGDFWSTDMNSFNHYAYGAVIDWIYEKAAGIRHDSEHPGFTKAIIAPNPDARLSWLDVALDTRNGKIVSRWTCREDGVRYEIHTPVAATIIIDGKATEVEPGIYTFWGAAK